MSLAELKAKTVNAKLWLPIEEMESEALTQIRNVASLPWAFHVAVMPDAHYGKGATVGSVIALKEAVSPSCVGVDIGCGMMAVKTNITANQLPDSLKEVRERIEKNVPVGFSSHSQSRNFPKAFKHGKPMVQLRNLLEGFNNLDKSVSDIEGRMRQQLGTLGGGKCIATLHRNM